MERDLKFKEEIYFNILDGNSIVKTGHKYKISEHAVERIMFEMMMRKATKETSVLGNKNEPYYDCEFEYGIMPEYNYEDLSENEKEFYESRN